MSWEGRCGPRSGADPRRCCPRSRCRCRRASRAPRRSLWSCTACDPLGRSRYGSKKKDIAQEPVGLHPDNSDLERHIFLL